MTVGRRLLDLIEEGLVEDNGKGGRMRAYRLRHGRQAGAKPKSSKRPSSDEEEAAVSHDLVAPVPRATHAPIATAHTRRSLPVFEVGEGRRLDGCENYDGCLSRFLKANYGRRGGAGRNTECMAAVRRRARTSPRRPSAGRSTRRTLAE
jgi:hypothetical protein